MAKTFAKKGAKTGYRVQAIEVEGRNMISVAQVYQTQKEPGTWKIGFRRITLPIEGAAKIASYIKKLAEDPDTEFEHVEFDKEKKDKK
jgi:hypothetical protein